MDDRDWQREFDGLVSTLKCAVLLAHEGGQVREQVDEVLRDLRRLYERVRKQGDTTWPTPRP